MWKRISYLVMAVVGYVMLVVEVLCCELFKGIYALSETVYENPMNYLLEWPLNVLFVLNLAIAVIGTLCFVREMKRKDD